MSELSNVHLRTDESAGTLVKQFVLSPLIYLRVLCVICSIIVFGCIADKGYILVPSDLDGDEVSLCILDGSSACSFATAIGVITFLIALAFFIKDVAIVLLDFSNGVTVKKVLLVADVGVSGFCTFMWFVTFCFTANERRKTDTSAIGSSFVNCMNSVIAFSFFSIILWGAILGVNVFYLIRVARAGSAEYSGFAENDPNALPPDGSDPMDTKGQYTAPEY